MRSHASEDLTRLELLDLVWSSPMQHLSQRFAYSDEGWLNCVIASAYQYFAQQVQEVLLEDEHPVLLVAGGEIARVLIADDFGADERLATWIATVKDGAKGR